MLKEHGHQIFCHDQFVDTQHNFEIMYLHLNYTGRRSSHERCYIKKLLIKFRNIHRKIPVLESFLKREILTQVFSYEHFSEHLF